MNVIPIKTVSVDLILDTIGQFLTIDNSINTTGCLRRPIYSNATDYNIKFQIHNTKGSIKGGL